MKSLNTKEMKKPKGMTSKTWKLHLQIHEMNRDIIKERRKNSMYVTNELDEWLFNAGEYKANRKKK